MSKLVPLSGLIVVKREEHAVKGGGTIFLTESAQDKPQRGTVIAVGAGKEGPAQVSVGDTILFKKYGPVEVEQDGETLLVLEESDLLAIIS